MNAIRPHACHLMAWVIAGCAACSAAADSPAAGPMPGPTDAASAAAQLDAGFRQVADDDRPWAYWWWVNGNVTEQSITRDLQEMKRQGIGGLLMFDSRNYHDDHLPPPPAPMEYMSPEWRKLLKFSIAEADRLGLEMSINLSSGAGALKGPWDVGDGAPKKLLWTSHEVTGPQRVQAELAASEAKLWDVALVAARHSQPAGETQAAADAQPLNTQLSNDWREVAPAMQGERQIVQVVDLSKQVDDQGRLVWDAPAGHWTLIRFVCAVMEGHENDVDILSRSAVEEYFGRLGGAFLEEAGEAAGRTLSHLYSVSWEGAAPTWTFELDRQFAQYRGYDMRPYLPVLAGMTVQGREVSERFLRDYHRTLADCFRDNCYGTLRELSHRAGLKWHSESGGPWNRKLPSFQHADQLAFLGRNDMPQGEFWHPGRAMNRPAAMASHLYGLPRAATEAFTHMRPHWTAYPAALKPDADAAFCDGINHFIWHTFTASPPEFGKPGIEYFAGSHLNPNVTWWEQSRAFLNYLARCQFLLRQGRFVSDVCVYTGDKPYLHWGRGEKWSESPTLTLGQGYTYDLMNSEVLLERVSVTDGQLTLPDGMRYRLLALDLEDETVSPQVLAKIAALVEAGATVVLGQRQPQRTPGLEGYPAADGQVRKLAGRLWESGDGAQRRRLGKGIVYTGTPLDDVLRADGVAPDFEGPWRYAHRSTGDAEIYFVAGSGDAECTFRVSGREPELFSPESGRVRDAVHYRASDDGRTIVPIRLPENGSVFVVFRRPAEPVHVTSLTAPAGDLEIEGRSAAGCQAVRWQAAECVLETSLDKRLVIPPAQLPEPQTIAGPWQVQFASGWGAPETATFDKLVAWDEHPDPGIRHFSGTATYRNTFQLDPQQAAGPVRLQLGEVKYIAEVRVNGQPLGVVWTDPWSLVLDNQTLRPGKNELEIDVVNLWVNRLIGDADLPKDKRLTGTNAWGRQEGGRIPHLRGYSSQDKLLRSGLLGPVRLEFGVRSEIAF